jgi:hypothetical protein
MSISSGVQAIVNRMASHPNEFFGDAGRWNFIFKDNFKDIMTEPEKAAIYDALKQVRRQQFETLVMTTLLLQDQEDQGEATEEQRERAYRLGNGGNRSVTSPLGYGKAI